MGGNGEGLGSVRWGVLGGVWVSVDGRRLSLSPQGRYVLAGLLREPGRSVPLDRLLRSALAATDQQLVNATRVAVSRLRGVLAATGAGRPLVTSAAGYSLDVDPMTVDHVAFSDGVRRAERLDVPGDSLRVLERALALWTGNAYGDLATDPSFDGPALALEEQRRSAVDLWCRLAVDVHRPAGLIARLESAVDEEPLREGRWYALMLAYYRASNQGAAVRAFDRARHTLVEQLGLEPGPELQRLLEAVLRQDPSLGWLPERPRVRVHPAAAQLRPTVPVGRETDIEDVLTLLERNRAVVITGYGGVGKTTLALEAAARWERSSWLVAFDDLVDADRLEAVAAAAMGITQDRSDSRAAMTEVLEDSGGLLVLDGCERHRDAAAELMRQVAAAAPSARILATSRVDLAVGTGFTFTLAPLPTGSRERPGPAALIAANAALVRPSSIGERWDDLEEICRRADGVPLVIELLGAAYADGHRPRTDVVDGLASAVHAAVASLPADTSALVDVLRAMPHPVGARFLAAHSGVGDVAVHRMLAPAVRAGLVVQRTGADGGVRVRLLEPVRDALQGPADPTAVLLESLRQTFAALASASRPSLVGAVETGAASMTDDEHELGLWLLERLPDSDALALACRLSPVWSACGRTVDGVRWLARLEREAAAAPPDLRARYWVMRAQASPALATRAPLIDRLRDAMATADRHGDGDLAARAGAELAVGLGWAGRLEEARRLLVDLEGRRPPGDAWAKLTLEGLASMALGLAGDPRRAAIELAAQADGYRGVGHSGDVAGKLFIAANLARLAGDHALLRRILGSGDDLVPDRFSSYSVGALRYERARLAVREDHPDAGVMLWEAYGLLRAHGDERTVAVCRRDLGAWRLAHGDPGGVRDLGRAARALLASDPPAAAVAVGHLVDATSASGLDSERRVLERAVAMLVAAPGGAPLDGDDEAFVAGRRKDGAAAVRPEDLIAVLDDIGGPGTEPVIEW